MPVTIAMIIAVSTDPMILFHSNDGIGVLFVTCPQVAPYRRIGRPSRGRQEIGFPPPTQTNYRPSGRQTNRACCRWPVTDRSRESAVPAASPIANPIVMIPARLAATRLPNKPLADIAGAPMIVHVWRRAVAASVGPVVVACGDA